MEQIVLKPEILGFYKQLPITNTLLVSWVAMIILTVVSIAATWKVKMVPEGAQNFFEAIIDWGHSTVEGLAGKKTKVFFPLVMTFFLFILTANLLGLIPGYGTISFKG